MQCFVILAIENLDYTLHSVYYTVDYFCEDKKTNLINFFLSWVESFSSPDQDPGEISLTFRNQFLPALIETHVRSQTSIEK